MTPEENYNNKWKEIVENSDGSINKDQLMIELLDFSHLINRMTSLTSRLTGGRLSYPTYSVDTIMNSMEDFHEQAYNDGYEDGKLESSDAYERGFQEALDKVNDQR